MQCRVGLIVHIAVSPLSTRKGFWCMDRRAEGWRRTEVKEGVVRDRSSPKPIEFWKGERLHKRKGKILHSQEKGKGACIYPCEMKE